MSCTKCSGLMLYEILYGEKRYRCVNCGKRIELRDIEQRDVYNDFLKSKAKEKKQWLHNLAMHSARKKDSNDKKDDDSTLLT